MITIITDGNIVEKVFDKKNKVFDKVAKNIMTNNFINLLKKDIGVETNLLGEKSELITHKDIKEIDGKKIQSNSVLYAELKKIL